ncbi:MAG: hypothetical protein GY906_10025 [bacterium]|nr:hypothetical protein [bacterium]
MAFTQRGVVEVGTTAQIIQIPKASITGLADGDFILVAGCAYNDSGVYSSSDFVVDYAQWSTGTDGTAIYAWMYVESVAALPTNLEIDSGGVFEKVVQATAFSGVDSFDWLDAMNNSLITANSATPSTPPVDTLTDDALVIAMLGAEIAGAAPGGDWATTYPAGFTAIGQARFAATNSAMCAMAKLLAASPGTVSPGTWTMSGTSATALESSTRCLVLRSADADPLPERDIMVDRHTVAGGSTASISFSKTDLDGLADGHLVVVQLGQVGFTNLAWTGPAGFDVVYDAYSGGTSGESALFWKYITDLAGEPDPWTFGNGDGGEDKTLVAIAISNVDPDNIVAAVDVFAEGLNDGSPPVPSIVVPEIGQVHLMTRENVHSSPGAGVAGWRPPDSYHAGDIQGSVGDMVLSTMAFRIATAAGAQTPGDFEMFDRGAVTFGAVAEYGVRSIVFSQLPEAPTPNGDGYRPRRSAQHRFRRPVR